MEFNIGDHVEVAGFNYAPGTLNHSTWKECPCPYTGQIGANTPVIWFEVVILYKIAYSGCWDYRIMHPKDNDSQFFISFDMVKTNLRPLVRTIEIHQPAEKMSESCLECKIQFRYPVEFNHKDGRVCFSCRSSYSWKYF